jgi:hypothetical protein
MCVKWGISTPRAYKPAPLVLPTVAPIRTASGAPIPSLHRLLPPLAELVRDLSVPHRRSPSPSPLRNAPHFTGFQAEADVPALHRRRCSLVNVTPQLRPPGDPRWAPNPPPPLPQPTPPPEFRPATLPLARGPDCKLVNLSRGLRVKRGHMCESQKTFGDHGGN